MEQQVTVKESALKLYLKVGNIYVFVLRAWKGNTGHAKRDLPAVFFEAWLDRMHLPTGVTSIHATYPANGEAHRTFDYADGRRVHIHRRHVTIRMPRVWNNSGYYEKLVVPSSDELAHPLFGLPAGILPPFADFKPDVTYGLGFGMAFYPLGSQTPPPDPQRLCLVEEVEPDSTIIDTNGMDGTLNVGGFLCSTPSPKEREPHDREVLLPTILRGDSPPYFGALVSLFPSEPAQTRLAAPTPADE